MLSYLACDLQQTTITKQAYNENIKYKIIKRASKNKIEIACCVYQWLLYLMVTITTGHGYRYKCYFDFELIIDSVKGALEAIASLSTSTMYIVVSRTFLFLVTFTFFLLEDYHLC